MNPEFYSLEMNVRRAEAEQQRHARSYGALLLTYLLARIARENNE